MRLGESVLRSRLSSPALPPRCHRAAVAAPRAGSVDPASRTSLMHLGGRALAVEPPWVGGWVLRMAYDGPLTSASRPDAYGRPRARHGAASFPKRPGWMCAAPRYPLRPYSSTAARGGLALGASPRPSEGSLGGDDTATMRAPPRPSTAPKALRMVLVLGLQRRRGGWSRGFPTVDAKWPAGARAKNQVDR